MARSTVLKIIGSFLAVLFVTIASVALVPARVYIDYIKQKSIAVAYEHGIKLTWGNSDLTIERLVAYDIRVVIPKYFLTLVVGRLELAPSYPSLFLLRPRMALSAEAYHGTIKAGFEHEFLSRGASPAEFLYAEGDGISIAQHPQLNALGIENGNLLFNFQRIDGGVRGEFELSDVSKPSPTILQPILTGLPLPLSIPAVNNLTVRGNVSMREELLTLSSLAISSSLGNCSGEAQIDQLANGKPIHSQVECTLSPDGLKAFGAFLPILSKGKISSTSSSFKVLVEGGLAHPKIEWHLT